MIKSFQKIFSFFYFFQLLLCPVFAETTANKSLPTINDIKMNGDDIVIEFSQMVDYQVSMLSNPPRLVMEIPETQYKVSFNRKDVSGALVKRIRGYQFKENPMISRIILDLKSAVNYKANPTGGELLISLTKNEVSEEQQVEEKKETRKPSYARKGKVIDLLDSLPREVITLDFESADIKDVIRLMSETSNINIIFGPEVAGVITIHLKKVPFDEAFKTILNLKGLVATQLGTNVLRVTTPAILTAERTKAVTITKTFPINYLKAADVSTHIQSVMAASGRRGTISVVLESNSLVVTDSEEGLDQAERLIAQLDQKPKQVMIEARLVEINLTNGTDIGVQWEYNKQNVHGLGDYSFVGLRAKSEGDARIAQTQTDSGGVDHVFGAIGPALGTGVNLPGPVSAGITFGFVKNNQILSATLAALINQSRARVLSSPKVVTVNGQQASIEAVQQIPFRTSTVANGVVSNSFTNVSAGIRMTVTPTINSQDRVTLIIRPEASFPTEQSTEAGPVIKTRNAQTTVIVKDGDTLVIGGLIDDSEGKSVDKVPLLGDLPIIGTFFRHQKTTKTRNELLVFVTPRIVRD